jgi:hypothetical protein
MLDPVIAVVVMLPASVTICNVGVATFKAWDAVTAYDAVNSFIVPGVVLTNDEAETYPLALILPAT